MKPRVLLLDCLDSFTGNLVHALEVAGADVRVVRDAANDEVWIGPSRPTHLILSPGPGAPDDAKAAVAAFDRASGRLPILGVCLGHQVLARRYGAEVSRTKHPRHGRASIVAHDGEGVFRGLPSPFAVARYHSLAVVPSTLPPELILTARSTDDDVVMGLRHRDKPEFGVQFHPESFLTECGIALLRCFLQTTY